LQAITSLLFVSFHCCCSFVTFGYIPYPLAGFGIIHTGELADCSSTIIIFFFVQFILPPFLSLYTRLYCRFVCYRLLIFSLPTWESCGSSRLDGPCVFVFVLLDDAGKMCGIERPGLSAGCSRSVTWVDRIPEGEKQKENSRVVCGR
jgi:hypothetical protein